MRPSPRSEAGDENCPGHKRLHLRIFFTGPPFEILKAWRDGRVQLLVSPSILDEYQRIGAELALQFRDVDLESFLDLLAVQAEIVLAPTLPPVYTMIPLTISFWKQLWQGKLPTSLVEINTY